LRVADLRPERAVDGKARSGFKFIFTFVWMYVVAALSMNSFPLSWVDDSMKREIETRRRSMRDDERKLCLWRK
jgi:hypothetical protein